MRAQVKQLRESARQHKRHAESHRYKAREEMQEAEGLERFLGELGVPVILEDEKEGPQHSKHPQLKGAQDDDSSREEQR